MHYIDTTSALAGCIQGCRGDADSNRIFQLLAVDLATKRCRHWAEFVESAANLADEPSREYSHFPIARSLGAHILNCTLPPYFNILQPLSLERVSAAVHASAL